jgi:hypothetical protein
MKTYLKHSNKDPLKAVYYSSADFLSHSSSRVDFRHRVVQPSTKEQQRLLSSSNKPQLQHVHLGKYGIRPLWPSDNTSHDHRQSNTKSSKVIIRHV